MPFTRQIFQERWCGPRNGMTAALTAFQIGLAPMLTATLSLGPRNTFVLRHGLARDHAMLVAGVCLSCDVTVIVAATLGFGAVVAANPVAVRALTWLGVGFLLLSAGRLVRSACNGDKRTALEHCGRSCLTTLIHAFGINVLNPLVWVETVLALSALSSTVSAPTLPYVGLGAALGSLCKFSLLSLAANRLASLFLRRSVRRGFDALAGTAMLAMALLLARPVFSPGQGF